MMFAEGYDQLEAYYAATGFEHQPTLESRIVCHGTWLSPAGLAQGAEDHGYPEQPMLIPRQPTHIGEDGTVENYGNPGVCAGKMAQAAVRSFFHRNNPRFANVNRYQGFILAGLVDADMVTYPVIPRQAAHHLTGQSEGYVYGLSVVEGQFGRVIYEDAIAHSNDDGEHRSAVCVRPDVAFKIRLGEISSRIIVTDATIYDIRYANRELMIRRTLEPSEKVVSVTGAAALAGFLNEITPSEMLSEYFA
jgi:hypothetical protein